LPQIKYFAYQMNKPIIKPEWIPSAYTNTEKKQQAETSKNNKPKTRLLKDKPKKKRVKN